MSYLESLVGYMRRPNEDCTAVTRNPRRCRGTAMAASVFLLVGATTTLPAQAQEPGTPPEATAPAPDAATDDKAQEADREGPSVQDPPKSEADAKLDEAKDDEAKDAVGGDAAASDQEIDPDFAAAINADAQAVAESPGSTTDRAVAQATQNVQMNPDISFILDTGLAGYSAKEHIRQGGHAIDDNGFGLQGVELAASASVDPFFRFDLNFALGHLHIEEAYLTTLALPMNLQMRAGYFNAQFGRQNPQHLHTWKFVNPPLSHSRFMSEEHFSGLGSEISALLPLPWYVMVIGEGYSTNANKPLRSSTFGGVDVTEAGRTDGLRDFVYVARLVNFFDLNDDWSLNLGVNGAWGQSPYVPDNAANLYGADLYLKWRPVSTGDGAMAVGLTLEYVLRDTQIPGDSVRDHGGYAQLDFQLNRFWMTSLRADTTDTLSGDPTGMSNLDGQDQRASAALIYMPSHFSKVRVQFDVGQQEDLPRYTAGFVQLEVSAGEHGAHTF